MAHDRSLWQWAFRRSLAKRLHARPLLCHSLWEAWSQKLAESILRLTGLVADSLHMVQKRHPGVVVRLLTHLKGVPTSATTVARSLDGVHGFELPSWRSLAAGARPPPRDLEDHEPGSPRQGWQHEASSRVEQDFRALALFPRLTDTQKTMLRSQSGPGGGAFLSTTPSNPLTRIDSFAFRTVTPLSQTSPCHSSVNAHTPVWPHHRSPWPPPCSMCSFWVFGSTGFCSGECRRSHLSRRWRPRCHQPDDSRS